MQYESWFRGALGVLFVASMIVGSPAAVQAQASGEVTNEPGAPDVPFPEPVVEQLYAAAVAAGLEERQVVETAFGALVARLEASALRQIYADAVRSGGEWPATVRQSLRTISHRREVWEEWPTESANILYAMSIASGAEPDSVLRERLFSILDRESLVREGLSRVQQPFCDASCGPDDPEHPLNIYETDIYHEWLGWYEHVFYGGPAPDVLITLDEEAINKLADGACEVMKAVSTVGSIADVVRIVKENPLEAKVWKKKIVKWFAKVGVKFTVSQVTGVGAFLNAAAALCMLTE